MLEPMSSTNICQFLLRTKKNKVFGLGKSISRKFSMNGKVEASSNELSWLLW